MDFLRNINKYAVDLTKELFQQSLQNSWIFCGILVNTQ